MFNLAMVLLLSFCGVAHFYCGISIQHSAGAYRTSNTSMLLEHMNIPMFCYSYKYRYPQTNFS